MTLKLWFFLRIVDAKPDSQGSELQTKHVNNCMSVKGNLPTATGAVWEEVHLACSYFFEVNSLQK